MKEYYKPGDWWLLCDQCHRKMRYSESTRRWDGLIVHADLNEGCFETRHPQDFVRSVRDMFPLPVVRPDNEGIESTLSINCDNIYWTPVDGQPVMVTYIGKGYTTGPVFIDAGWTVTVLCEWIIN